MARRRELKCIASGLAAHCASRNNDIFGYWGVGVIFKVAIGHGVQLISVDIFSHGALCPELAEFRRLFREKLVSSGLDARRFIEGFVVEFQFEPHPVPDIRGPRARALCTVHIIDDLGKCRSASAATFCVPHHPQFEHKSTRAGTVASLRVF